LTPRSAIIVRMHDVSLIPLKTSFIYLGKALQLPGGAV